MIACGGGGVPVTREGAELVGVDAVIDKDFAASLIGRLIGATSLLLVTGVDQVLLDFGAPTQRAVASMSVGRGARAPRRRPVPARQHGSQDRGGGAVRGGDPRHRGRHLARARRRRAGRAPRGRASPRDDPALGPHVASALPGGGSGRLGAGAGAPGGPAGLRQLHDLPRRVPDPRLGSGRRLPRRRHRARPHRVGRPRLDGQPHRALAARAGRHARGRRRGARGALLPRPRRGPARPDGERAARTGPRRRLRPDRHRGRAGRGRLRRADVPRPRRRGDRHGPGLLPLRPRPAAGRGGAGLGAARAPATAGASIPTRWRRPSPRARG